MTMQRLPGLIKERDALQDKIDDAVAAKAQEDKDKLAADAIEMAKKILAALNADVLDTAGAVSAPSATVTASPDGMLTVKSDGYARKGAADEIAGWQGAELTNDGDTLVVYSNIGKCRREDTLSAVYGNQPFVR